MKLHCVIFCFGFVINFSALSLGFGVESLWSWTNQMIDGPEKVLQNVTIVFTPDTYSAVFLPLKGIHLLPNHKRFDRNKDTVIYFHGWLESGKLDLSALAIRGAYLDRGDHNVISVDWSFYAKNFNYPTRVIPQMKIIAEAFAEQLKLLPEYLYPINRVHLVGHSLGAQMAGKIGRHLKEITKGELSIKRIFALDPAGPGFEDYHIDNFEAINRDDADYVQIIHTCGGKLGMLHRVGHADFYPDGGSSHPGCDVDVAAEMIEPYRHICDHARSWHFYQATVRDHKRFPAIRCNSWDDFISGGACFPNDIAYMGFGADDHQTGKFYLQTNGNLFNLSRRMDGTHYKKVALTRMAIPGDESPIDDIPIEMQTHVIC